MKTSCLSLVHACSNEERFETNDFFLPKTGVKACLYKGFQEPILLRVDDHTQ